jgi:hypothetical protein
VNHSQEKLLVGELESKGSGPSLENAGAEPNYSALARATTNHVGAQRTTLQGFEIFEILEERRKVIDTNLWSVALFYLEKGKTNDATIRQNAFDQKQAHSAL